MGGGIHPVGRKPDLYDIVGGEMQIILGRCAWHSGRVQHHYALMGSADPELVLGADHAVGLHAPDL